MVHRTLSDKTYLLLGFLSPLIIASSIINDIIGEFETESSLHSDCQLSRKTQIEW